MANLDNEEEVIDIIESEESEQFIENNEEEVVNQLFTDEQAKLLKRFGVNPDNATTDDLIKLAERAYNSESKKVELKKQNKLSIPSSREDIKKIIFEEKFYEKNPDAENYRDKIENYQTINKLSLQDAYDLATKPDKIIEENRKIYWKWVIKWNTQGIEWIALVSMDDYNNMTDDQINKYDSDMKSKYWVVKWK